MKDEQQQNKKREVTSSDRLDLEIMSSENFDEHRKTSTSLLCFVVVRTLKHQFPSSFYGSATVC